MKKVVLTALNAKYFHTNLALRCLKAAAGAHHDIEIVERTINDNMDDVLEEIVALRPDSVGFSCYIWNIEHVLFLADNLKKVLPDCFLFMGGPEVSFESQMIMERHYFIDMIIQGEGEITFGKWISAFDTEGDLKSIEGTIIRADAGIMQNPARIERYDLNELPFLYNDLKEYENKIIYFESSRGCPFNCAYCMSGNAGDISFMDFDKVQNAFSYFLENNVRQVKLVDRTFNHPISRAKQILNMLIEEKKRYPDSTTNFHFEITASIFDDELYEILKDAPHGLIQFEAGVQSTNAQTLEAISRDLGTAKLLSNIKKIMTLKNITVYADLIAGLPYESYDDFKKSFNDVYELKTDKIHLGFLKVLKGSGIRQDADKYGIVYSAQAPYKVLRTNDISYLELRKLERIERLLEIYKNSGNFEASVQYAVNLFETPLDFYEKFMDYAWAKGLVGRNQGILKQFDLLHGFMTENTHADESTLKDKLLYDWAMMEKPRRYPTCIKTELSAQQKEFSRKFYNAPENIEKYLPDYIKHSPQTISRMCHIAFFDGGKRVILFDYKKPKNARITDIT